MNYFKLFAKVNQILLLTNKTRKKRVLFLFGINIPKLKDDSFFGRNWQPFTLFCL